MQPLTKKFSVWNINSFVVSLAFFSAFYFYLWLYIEPHIIYHHYEITQKSPFFKTGWLFLRDCLGYPGGPGQYVAAFFSQMNYHSWLGALCVTLVAWIIYLLTASLTKIAPDSPWRIICYIPSLLMLMICARYEDPFKPAVAVLVVLFFSVLYGKLSFGLGLKRLILFPLLTGIVYYIAGAAAFVFTALIVLRGFFNGGDYLWRRTLFSVVCFILGLAVCWFLGSYAFELEANEVYLYSSPFFPEKQNVEKEMWARIFECTLFVILPVIVLLVDLIRKLAGIARIQNLKVKYKAVEWISGRFHKDAVRWSMQIFLLILISVPSVLYSFNRHSKRWIQLSDFACRKMWPEVLAAAREIPLQSYSGFCNHVVNRALFFTGQMGDKMFTYPQSIPIIDLVFSRDPVWNVILMERSEMCLELGLVNPAEKIAHEFLEGSDNSPFIIKQIATLNIIRGQTETARVYLRMLSRNIWYRKEAMALLRRLETDPQLESDKRIKQLRSVSMTANNVCTIFHDDELLEELLRRNKHNKMAFEYLMAYYLVTRKLEKVVENLPRLDDFDYNRIPRHYEEAILIYMGKKREKIDLDGRRIRSETIRQFNEFNRILKEVDYNRRVAYQKLAPKFGRTYFFYYSFGLSGITQ